MGAAERRAAGRAAVPVGVQRRREHRGGNASPSKRASDDDGETRKPEKTAKKSAKTAPNAAPQSREQKALAKLDASDVRSRLRKLPAYAEKKVKANGGADVITFSYGDPINRGKTYAEMTVSFQRFATPEKAAAFETGLRKAMKGRAATVVRGGDRLLAITCHRARAGNESSAEDLRVLQPSRERSETATAEELIMSILRTIAICGVTLALPLAATTGCDEAKSAQVGRAESKTKKRKTKKDEGEEGNDEDQKRKPESKEEKKLDTAKVAALAQDLKNSIKREAAHEALVAMGPRVVPLLALDLMKICNELKSAEPAVRFDLMAHATPIAGVLLELGERGEAALETLFGEATDNGPLIFTACTKK